MRAYETGEEDLHLEPQLQELKQSPTHERRRVLKLVSYKYTNNENIIKCVKCPNNKNI